MINLSPHANTRVRLRLGLHGRGFKSTWIHDFETITLKKSVHTETIFLFSVVLRRGRDIFY